MKLTVNYVSNIIKQALPEGSVIPVFDETGHHYKVMTPDKDGTVGNVYPSVTGKLQVIKDESLAEYKKNRALDYIFAHWNEFTQANVMEHLDKAGKEAQLNLENAGDIGTIVHELREKYFKGWIAGHKAISAVSCIPAGQEDVRVVSCLRALDKFCLDYNYTPITCELYVYSHKLKVGGTLDDIGFTTRITKEGNPNCEHDMIEEPKRNIRNCVKCGQRVKDELTLIDIKTSNAFKDHYFFQVGLYRYMFCKLTELKIARNLIVKLSKKDGTYGIEDLKQAGILGSYAKSIMRMNDGVTYVRKLRKDNQRSVVTL